MNTWASELPPRLKLTPLRCELCKHRGFFKFQHFSQRSHQLSHLVSVVSSDRAPKCSQTPQMHGFNIYLKFRWSWLIAEAQDEVAPYFIVRSMRICQKSTWFGSDPLMIERLLLIQSSPNRTWPGCSEWLSSWPATIWVFWTAPAQHHNYLCPNLKAWHKI